MIRRLVGMQEVLERAANLDTLLRSELDPRNYPYTLAGVPRGGVPVALVLRASTPAQYTLIDDWRKADIIVDDIIGSGATEQRCRQENPGAVFLALFNRPVEEFTEWLVFPWEVTEGGQDRSAYDIPQRLLEHIGEDAARAGLHDTPERFIRAWAHWTSGYEMKPEDVLTTFADGAENYDEMILLRDYPVWSHCEHHLAPFFGKAHVAYVPNGHIVGLSKLGRLVEVFARRLQVQERLTVQIADALNSTLQPDGVGVVLECRHACMESRGICKAGLTTVTSAMRGSFREDGHTRSEFLKLIGG